MDRELASESRHHGRVKRRSKRERDTGRDVRAPLVIAGEDKRRVPLSYWPNQPPAE
jgi:hypothetical protein